MTRIMIVRKWSRLVASVLCLSAFAVYLLFAPTPAYTESCTCLYAGQSYSDGACRGGQRCGCNGTEGFWWNDQTCARELD